jgi:hypothetical protein
VLSSATWTKVLIFEQLKHSSCRVCGSIRSSPTGPAAQVQ